MKKIIIILFCLFFSALEASKAAQLEPKMVQTKINEIMQGHASYKVLSPVIVRRALQNYIENLDPTKMYFLEADVHQWLDPSDALVDKILNDYHHAEYPAFYEIHERMAAAIVRRHHLQEQVDAQPLPQHVKLQEFKDMKWTADEQELANRLLRVKALQHEAVMKLSEDLRSISLQRIAKQRCSYEDEILLKDPKERKHLVLTNVLKATASSLDTHTAYFTPAEATQFMIGVQQRLFGIGAQLQDNINGLSVVKIVEGGPASLSKELKVKDRIIAVNNEPVVGLDITDAVDLIRGEENTPVTLTVVREVGEENEAKHEEILNITLHRGAVVIKEARFESTYEPYGDGAIAYLRLFSFYQDTDSSSATDLAQELKRLKAEQKINGVILDLRYNSGGVLMQAVDVAALFITKGVVVSIKDYLGRIQHLRNTDAKTVWDGPLIILMNRASASASEIVAQALKDYGRAIIVGDAQSYGKGSFQSFTLHTGNKGGRNAEGEYKVTQGRYYTVSGKTPQMVGVSSDVIIPGALSETDIGEKYAKYPLENDEISDSFDDSLLDVPLLQRDKLGLAYKFNQQPRLHIYTKYLPILKKNSDQRLKMNKQYQAFLALLQKKDKDTESDESDEMTDHVDWQLVEAYNVMRDLIFLMM